jgi:hypothetical protein
MTVASLTRSPIALSMIDGIAATTTTNGHHHQYSLRRGDR